jgi:Protein of unknown function (DUF1018)
LTGYVLQIEFLTAVLGLSEKALLDCFFRLYGRNKPQDLSAEQADSVIDTLRSRAVTVGIFPNRRTFDGRQGFADGSQISMIEYLWSGLESGHSMKVQRKRLQELLSEQIGVSDVRFVSRTQAEQLIERLLKKYLEMLQGSVRDNAS